MGAMLNEESIAGLLAGTVSHLETGNLEQAEVALHILDFERLLRPIRSNTKPSQISDPLSDGDFFTEMGPWGKVAADHINDSRAQSRRQTHPLSQ
jgi:hypothetical protein